MPEIKLEFIRFKNKQRLKYFIKNADRNLILCNKILELCINDPVWNNSNLESVKGTDFTIELADTNCKNYFINYLENVATTYKLTDNYFLISRRALVKRLKIDYSREFYGYLHKILDDSQLPGKYLGAINKMLHKHLLDRWFILKKI